MLLSMTGGLAACGNAVRGTQAGRLGITVDTAGRPVAIVLTCATATPEFDLYEGRTPSMSDDEPNVHRGTWTARAAFAGVQEVSLLTASAGWTRDGRPDLLESRRLFVLTGGIAEDNDAYLSQVSFRASDLNALSPDQVRTEDKVESRAEFGGYQCR